MKPFRKHGVFASAKATGGQPDEQQLAIINQYTLEDATNENVYVRTVYLAHNGIDRDRDVFDDALLADFARTLPGKGIFIKHPMSYDGDSGPGVGRWFTARVLDLSQDEARAVLREPDLQFPPANERAKVLEASFFLPRTDKYAGLIQDIDYGAAGDVSIGFTASDRSPITDGQSDQPIADRILGPGQALEGSLVWLGAQPGARVHKHLDLFDDEDPEMDEVKELKQKISDQKAEHETAMKKKDEEIAALKSRAASFDAIVKALGEDGKDLAGKPEEIAKAVADAKSAHVKLVDDVIAAERVAGLVDGDDEKAVNELKTEYKGYSRERLERLLVTAKKRVPGGNLGGDPNETGAQGKDTRTEDEKDYDNAVDNPLLFGGGQAA